MTTLKIKTKEPFCKYCNYCKHFAIEECSEEDTSFFKKIGQTTDITLCTMDYFRPWRQYYESCPSFKIDPLGNKYGFKSLNELWEWWKEFPVRSKFRSDVAWQKEKERTEENRVKLMNELKAMKSNQTQ